ncbi:MAG: PAS domain-containing protein, partial [Planctomycetia bacterium]|nr:PAS domain-containing protein [Planctomycetia bacterium]
MDQHEPTPQQLQAEVQDLRARLAQAEAALASQPAMAEQLRLFVEHAPAAIAMLDRDMKYLLASRRWQTEYQLEGQDLIGRSHYEVFPNLSDDWKAFHRRCLAGETIARDEDSFTLADGSLCWLRWAIHPWHDARGAVGGLLIFSEVIT